MKSHSTDLILFFFCFSSFAKWKFLSNQNKTKNKSCTIINQQQLALCASINICNPFSPLGKPDGKKSCVCVNNKSIILISFEWWLHHFFDYLWFLIAFELKIPPSSPETQMPVATEHQNWSKRKKIPENRQIREVLPHGPMCRRERWAIWRPPTGTDQCRYVWVYLPVFFYSFPISTLLFGVMTSWQTHTHIHSPPTLITSNLNFH